MLDFIPPWAKILAIVLLVSAAGGYGYMKGVAAGDLKVANYAKEKSDTKANYEKKLAEKKVEIVTQYVDKWNVIKQKEYINVETAKNDVPRQHDMSNGFVYLHDVSARNAEADGTRSSDASPSGVGDNQALAVIVTNYSRFYQCTEQVKSLQSIINEHNKTIDELNEKKK